MSWNSGDKTGGAKTSRPGKDKGDPAGANRRPILTMGRQTGRNITSQGKDVKVDNNITPLLETRGKSKTQSTITSFFAGGTEESCNTLTTPSSGDSQSVTESVPVGALSEKTLMEIKEPPTTAAQPGDGGLVGLDSCVVVRRKEKDSPISQEWPLAQQPVNLMQAEDVSNIKPTQGIEAGQNTLLNPGRRDKENEKEMKILDWAKDSGDKFYSLTEESDFSSGGDHSLSESGSSVSSERGNLSSSNEPTVRQRRRQQTRIESRRARVATKRLQGAVRKVAKSCTDIEAKLGSMDERIAVVEEDVDILEQQNAT
ncbi:hypothetical protein NDU88_007982 [Pleurodeles waltl]|uniref:Uncharacterized protein n=1 Tax=Pleurodeles waltl TaxID=8319 RepID=A0AAV7QPH5_PLEWA|nr:hypothetical protein NDU88_007982 [Pleurodeles waltl]